MSWRRFFGTWLLIAFVMSANGILRETVLVPVVKRTAADVVSAAIGITVILTITHWLLAPLHLSRRTALRVGFAWAALAVGFDFLVGHYVDAKSWEELAANYALWEGKLWPAVLSTVVVAPLLSSRAHEETSPAAVTVDTRPG